jgi:thioredoxin 1
MSEVLKLNDDSFDAEVLQSETPVLVDFGAPWCGPCKQLDPIMDELATTFTGRLKIAKVDIQESQAIAVKYGVMAVPTLLFMKGGEVQDQITGSAPSKAKLEEKISQFLG